MDQDTLVQRIEQLSADLELLHRAVHGSETETVLLGGVATPSYRKLVADVDARESAVAKTEIAKGVEEAQRIADTAGEAVTAAASEAVGAATIQANLAKEYADAAKASIPENLVNRVASVENTNAQQDARLDGVENITNALIGSVLSITAADGYVPNGTVPADAAEYTREQFREFYDTYLAGGKLLTCTYAAFAAQVALTGNCVKFALDASAQKFKVPLVKNGDSITQAASAAELGKSYKAGLPNIEGWTGLVSADGTLTGPFYKGAAVYGVTGVGYSTNPGVYFGSNRANAIYGNSTTVTDEQVRLRHFVVVASAQNNASVFDWSNYMAGLAGKANLDMNNLTPAGTTAIAHYSSPSNTRIVGIAVPASLGSFEAPGDGDVTFVGNSTAVGGIVQMIGAGIRSQSTLSQAANNSVCCTIRVSKGTQVQVYYVNVNNLVLTFNYNNGAF